jgi:hypothetical protein
MSVQWLTGSATAQGNSGGFVSPAGLSFIGKLTTGERLLSVQRIILDEKLAYAAESAGATLLDGFTVKVRSHHGSQRRLPVSHSLSRVAWRVQSVKWNPEDELWTVVLDTMDTHGENCTAHDNTPSTPFGSNARADAVRALQTFTGRERWSLATGPNRR